MADVSSFGINTETDEIIDETGGGGKLLPEGWIKGIVVGDEIKETKSGNGDLLSLELFAPDFDALVYTNLNLWNTNPKASQIARGQLAALVKACGLTTVVDTAQLHNKVFAFKNKHQEYKGKTRNNVSGFKPLDAVDVFSDLESNNHASAAAPKSKSEDFPW